QPVGKDRPSHLGGHHQSAMDLRAGSSTAERRTWPRSLRGSILAGPASSCAHDDDRLRLPPVSPAQNRKPGKKESTGRHLNRHCPPCAKPSSNWSLGHHRSDARTAENGFAAQSGVNKSAKVVLGQAHLPADILTPPTPPAAPSPPSGRGVEPLSEP